MEANKVDFVKNDNGKLTATIELPGRINFYARFNGKGSVKAYVTVDGISEPVHVGTSDYGTSVAMDINLIPGTTVMLTTGSDIAEAVYTA